MSQFKQKLDQARRRQKKVYFITGTGLLLILLLVSVLFIISRGTRVEIMPEDAKEQAVISVTRGLGLSVGDRVYSLAGNPVVTASAPGFKPSTATIDSAHLGKVFPLELFELPGRIIIRLSGEDKNHLRTVWQVNGRDAAYSDMLDIELEAGVYTVTVNNPFFLKKDVTVEIKRRELTELQVDLQPVAGVLDIISQPAGAKVFLDGQEVGLTPLMLDKNGGHYSLRLAAENYMDTVEEVEVTAASPEVRRKYFLELNKAKVHVDLAPKGGTILVNGVKAMEPLVLDATVQHRLTYLKAGYYPQTKDVLLAADEEKQLSFHLQEEIGPVEISSSPAATVLINGKDYGLSPVKVNLSAVTHTVTFQKAGYRTVSKTVTPKGGTTKKIAVTLPTEKNARLQEAQREYTNQEGVKLKLFALGDTFTMGAARSEKGQRANEFQRKVSLTKPFYAGMTEISNGQFARFDSKKAGSSANTPVTSVSWQEAAVYCNWLSAQEDLRPFYKIINGQVTGFNTTGDGYRLLTEAEWEWLARKSGKTAQTIFTWGNETVIPPKTTNVADESAKGQVRFYVPNYSDGFAGVAPVGSFNIEPSGLYDMAGNVSEWVHDVYSIVPPRPDTAESNPLGSQQGQAHVVKGGNFRSGTITTLRPAFREGLTEGRDDVGLRVGRYLYGGENE